VQKLDETTMGSVEPYWLHHDWLDHAEHFRLDQQALQVCSGNPGIHPDNPMPDPDANNVLESLWRE
jgi:hypothetical protein